MKKIVPFILAAALFALAGCDLNTDAETKATVARLDCEVKRLSELVDAQGKDLKTLTSAIPAVATITPSDKGYALMACPGGYFTVSCEGIKEYATGSEVVLEVLNLLSVKLTNVRLTITYYPLEADKAGEEWFASGKATTENITSLDPGKAALVTIRLPEYKPDKVRILAVSATVGGNRYDRQKP